MLAASGEQHEISGDGYRAVVTEGGATLRVLEHRGRALVAGFAVDARPPAGHGQVLAPWPNRVVDATYEFGGQEHRLPVTERDRGHANHGLVRWTAWTVEERTPHSVSLVYRLMAQPGYPWTLDLHVLYDLSADGLTVTTTATNMSPAEAPYGQGAHPYLTTGNGRVDDWEVTCPARTRLVVDERMVPTGEEPVGGTAYDLGDGRRVGDTRLDHAFTDLGRDEGVAWVRLRDPGTGHGTALWADRTYPWLQLYSGDGLAVGARESLAVEPMSCPPGAFGSGRDLRTLAPAGEAGDEHSGSWGITADPPSPADPT